MKTKFILLIVLVGTFVSIGFTQSAKITSKKVTYKRTGAEVPDFKRKFTITYPKVAGKMGRKIENLLSYEKNFELNLQEEIKEVHWLTEAGYKVSYNQNNILSVQLMIEGVGAYPSGSAKQIVVNLKNGNLVKTSDVFTNLNDLAAKCRQLQQKEIKEEIERLKKDESAEDVEETFKDKNFSVQDLDVFSVSPRGVTFYYDYGFPHVIKAWEPSGEYLFGWSELKPYIKKGGLFAQFAK